MRKVLLLLLAFPLFARPQAQPQQAPLQQAQPQQAQPQQAPLQQAQSQQAKTLTQPFRPFKKYPFPTELNASSTGATLTWAMDEEGRRNVYAASGPNFIPRMLTAFSTDDGQEISSLSTSDNGQWVVFVRGGDHGANWESDEPVNPDFETQPFKVQIASIPFAGGPVKYLSEGDGPVISPDSKEVAFIKNGQAWSAPIDGSAPAKNLFTTRGKVGGLQWSPDGRSLLFVTNRTDHSVIGVFTKGTAYLKWIAPSFSRDETPQWSADGRQIVFVRRPGSGGAPDSLLVNKRQPWSIYIADTAGAGAAAGAATGAATGAGAAAEPRLLWKAPATLRGSFPSTHGEANLHWAANNHIVFLSYQDGWPHLYSIDAGGSGAAQPGGSGTPLPKPTLLNPGNFMCEHIVLSPDKRHLLFSANAGPDTHDIERRHACMVSVDKADMQVLTPGAGLEWTPTMTGDGSTIAFISATAQQPPLPTVMVAKEKKILCTDRIPADFPQNKLVTPTAVVFKAADGVIVHADLFMPPAAAGAATGNAGNTSATGAAAATGNTSATAAAAARKPAIIYVHGGPPRQMLLGWNYSDYYSNAYAANQYLASLGFVVLAVNYRLGIGYGYEFHKPAKGGAAGASEYMDIKAAGEWLRKQHFVDTAKIGIYGGSYGGYLTALALARDSKLFKAGVDFHGVHDWTASSSQAARDKYEKAPDFDLAQRTAWLSSPVSSITTWKSPVLIIQGDDDRNVRFNQSVDLINRLEKKGVPYETLMIVDDTHHWMHFDNAVTVYGAAADFFVRKFMK
ncbi:MAG TPA: prolyl oligopeptidase family serine peptidase [Puia sp.]|jgi:dipeptidyl aminopeptidase/acylaminoacyl peptidase